MVYSHSKAFFQASGRCLLSRTAFTCSFLSQIWLRLAQVTRKIANLGVTLASNASKYVSFTKAATEAVLLAMCSMGVLELDRIELLGLVVLIPLVPSEMSS